MKRLYLLGYPLGHSVSPAMQNAALRACGLDGWQYETWARPREQLEAALQTVRAADCAGANVTIPHKQAVIPFLDGLSETAQPIGAVNTLYKRDGLLLGENTDGAGFMQALREQGVDPRDCCAFIFGAGGAAAAVAFALARAGARQLVLVNRTAGRAAELADRLHAACPSLALAVNWWAPWPRADLIVNATAIGMTPATNASPLPAGREIPRGALVFDLVYNPLETRLMQQARRAGARAAGGLDMLVYQGARAFELWTGRPAPVEVMRAAALAALAEVRP